MPQITKETIEGVADKVKLIEEPARMETMKEKIEIKEVKDKIQLYQPQMFKEVDKRIAELKTTMPTEPMPSPIMPSSQETGGQSQTPFPSLLPLEVK